MTTSNAETPSTAELCRQLVKPAETLAGWKRAIEANAIRSKEIDGLSASEARQYVDQRRQFEPSDVSRLCSYSCR